MVVKDKALLVTPAMQASVDLLEMSFPTWTFLLHCQHQGKRHLGPQCHVATLDIFRVTSFSNMKTHTGKWEKAVFWIWTNPSSLSTTSWTSTQGRQQNLPRHQAGLADRYVKRECNRRQSPVMMHIFLLVHTLDSGPVDSNTSPDWAWSCSPTFRALNLFSSSNLCCQKSQVSSLPHYGNLYTYPLLLEA